MNQTLLFCVVFLSQILLISWAYPRRVISRRKYVLQNFPQSTHPKLYPQPVSYYERRLRSFERLNLAVVVAGLFVIVGLVVRTLRGNWDTVIVTPWSASGEWDAAIVVPFFLVQMFACMYLDLTSRKHQKSMANAPPPRVRTTELRPRQLFDFVSPAMLILAVVLNVAFIAFVLYYRRFEMPWFTAAGNIAVVAVMLLVFVVMVGLALRAPKSDPYQAPRDRRNSIRLMVKLALAFSIAFPVLTTAHLILKLFDSALLEPVFTSLFLQGCALAVLWPLYSHREEDMDFDVYRPDTRELTPHP